MHKSQVEMERMFKKVLPGFVKLVITERRDSPYFAGVTLVIGNVHTDNGVFDFTIPVQE